MSSSGPGAMPKPIKAIGFNALHKKKPAHQQMPGLPENTLLPKVIAGHKKSNSANFQETRPCQFDAVIEEPFEAEIILGDTG
jgi:hypothetical protein